jgi:uncharacterized protein YceK
MKRFMCLLVLLITLSGCQQLTSHDRHTFQAKGPIHNLPMSKRCRC